MQYIPTVEDLNIQSERCREVNLAFLNSLDIHKYNVENLTQLQANHTAMTASSLKEMISTCIKVQSKNLREREKVHGKFDVEQEKYQLGIEKYKHQRLKNIRERSKKAFNKKLQHKKAIIEIVRFIVILLGVCLAAIGVFIVILQTPQVALPQGGHIITIEVSDAFKGVGIATLALMGTIILTLGIFLLFDKPIQ